MFQGEVRRILSLGCLSGESLTQTAAVWICNNGNATWRY